MGVKNADMKRLAQIVERPPRKLKGLNFIDLFIWLSASMHAVAQSSPYEQLVLPPPHWGTVYAHAADGTLRGLVGATRRGARPFPAV